MSARTRRHKIDVPLSWPVVAALLGSYFLASGAVGAVMGRGIAQSLEGIAPPVLVASLSVGAFTTAAGLALTRARVLLAIAIRITE